MTLLRVDHLVAAYGRSRALFDVSFEVGEAEMVALLGANGAGKTTTLLAVAGYVKASGGEVVIEGRPVTGEAPHKLARAGLGFVPDDRALIPGLTVADNLALVRGAQSDPFAHFPELERLANRRAGVLSGGEQQMLALARVLASHPRLLLIDELSLGLSPVVVTRLLKALRDAVDELGTSVLLVEQHVEQALAIADRGYVMRRGRIVMEGTSEELRCRRDVLDASYLDATA
jgi:branched-chain amino acid transport system ATP-binding protein